MKRELRIIANAIRRQKSLNYDRNPVRMLFPFRSTFRARQTFHDKYFLPLVSLAVAIRNEFRCHKQCNSVFSRVLAERVTVSQVPTIVMLRCVMWREMILWIGLFRDVSTRMSFVRLFEHITLAFLRSRRLRNWDMKCQETEETKINLSLSS